MTSAKATLYLFSVGPPELRVLLGWRRGRLLGPFRTIEAARRGRRPVQCGPDLEAEALAAGIPCGPLPGEVLEARALFAAFTLWQAGLVGSPPPATVRSLLDAARDLHGRWAGVPASWSLEVDGRSWHVSLEGSAACTGLVARCEDAPLELSLRLERGPGFAARALADAGWPVLPVPAARVGSARRPLDLEDLAALARIARRAAARLPARPRIGEEAGGYDAAAHAPSG